MLSDPKVTKKEGIESTVVSKPLIKPKAAPVARATTAPTSHTSPNLCMARAATTPARAMTDPTDRSNSPEIITRDMPTAIIETSVVWRPMLAKFSGVRNTGEAMAKITIKATKPTYSMPPEVIKDLTKSQETPGRWPSTCVFIPAPPEPNGEAVLRYLSRRALPAP